MNSFICFVSLALLASAVHAQYNRCANQLDGTIVEFGCYSYRYCEDGKEMAVTCPEGSVFERDSESCKTIGTGNTACGTTSANVCPDGTFNGLIADKNCQTFFSCVWGSYWPNSRRYCPNTSLFYNNACQSAFGAPSSCVRTIVTTTTVPTNTTTSTTTTVPTTTTTTTTTTVPTTTTSTEPTTTTTTTTEATTTIEPTTEAAITTEPTTEASTAPEATTTIEPTTEAAITAEPTIEASTAPEVTTTEATTIIVTTPLKVAEEVSTSTTLIEPSTTAEALTNTGLVMSSQAPVTESSTITIVQDQQSVISP